MAWLGELIHGQKPEVAPFEPTDPLQELLKLLSGEIKDWPQISQLGDLFQKDVFSKLEAAGIPFRNIVEMGSQNVEQAQKNALALQKGIMPPLDVKANLRGSAFQNLGSGLLGSFAGTANSLRNLGIGGYEAMQKGVGMASEAGNAAQRWMQMAMGTVLPAASQLYSPEWFTQFMAQQRQAKQATQQMRYNVAAAPDPVISGIAGTVMNLVGAYLGAGRGGGGNMLQTSDPNAMANVQSVPAGGVGGGWAQFTGQPYDMLGSNTGANTTIQYNAPAFQTNPDGSLFYPTTSQTTPATTTASTTQTSNPFNIYQI